MGRILHAKCRSLIRRADGRRPGNGAGPLDRPAPQLLGIWRLLADRRDRVEPMGVIRFLVLDPDFPRAIRFCVARCRESLQGDRRRRRRRIASEAERLLGRLESELRYIDVGEIFDRGLLPFLDGIQTTCHRVGDEIQRSYFA